MAGNEELLRFVGANTAAVRKLNIMVDRLQALQNINGGDFINVNRTGGGTSISLSMERVLERIPKLAAADGVHVAYPTADADNHSFIMCYKDVDTTGEEILVNCSIAGGGNLEDATPRLTNGKRIFVKYIEELGSWYCTTVFQASTDCGCS